MNAKNSLDVSAPLRAFHNDQAIKDKYLNRVRAHKKADEIANGFYWEDGKGCAVGCTIHGSDHSRYETELGIPRVLARLEDRLFEGLFATKNAALAKEWPEKFLSAAPVGADLSMVWPKFALWMLMDEEYGVIKFAKSDRSKEAIKNVAALYGRWINGTKPARDEWSAASYAAYAAYAAADAASYAAYAAYAAADAAAYAAYAVAAYAAYAVAADAAAYAAAYAAYAVAADAAARGKHYVRMAGKLLELMEDSK